MKMSLPFRLPIVFLFCLGIAFHACSANCVLGIDRVHTRNGIESGEITKVDPLSVTLTKGGVDKKIAAENIRSVIFENEPDGLSSARNAAQRERFEQLQSKLQEINRQNVTRDEIRQEIDYLDALGTAELALAGQGDLQQAAGRLARFLSTHRTSFHVPEVIELLGEIYLELGQHEEARQQFATLGKARTPYYQAKSALLTGRALQTEGDHEQAIETFQESLDEAGNSTATATIRREATLLMAVSRSAIGDSQSATDTVKQIIATADTEEIELLAQAYSALGDCYLQSGEKAAARDAFLHVDLLFSKEAESHTKALYELARLWEETGHPTRARETRARLEQEYPNSRWTRKL